MNKSHKTRLAKLYSDKTSGSSDILEELHRHLKQEQKTLQVFPELINEIKLQFKSFQTVQNYIKELEKFIYQREKLDDFFKKYDELLYNVYTDIYSNCRSALKKCRKIITISNSKTVFEILKLLQKDQPKLEIIVSESRPKLEGRIIADKLSKQNISVELITEAAMASNIPNVDAALIGSDAILKNNNAVNKIGSFQLAVLCKHYSVPFYVVVDKQKYSSNNNFEQEEMSHEEIWRNSNPRIKIKNLYFEEVDKKYITKIFS